MSKTRPSVTIAAFTIAPLVAAIAMAILTPTGKDADVLVVAGLTPIFYIFAAAPTLIIGVPLYFALSHYRLLNLCTVLLCGALIGALCTFALRYSGPIQRNDFLLTVSIGMLSSFAFWAVVRYPPKKKIPDQTTTLYRSCARRQDRRSTEQLILRRANHGGRER